MAWPKILVRPQALLIGSVKLGERYGFNPCQAFAESRPNGVRCEITRTALLSDQFGHLVWPGFAPCGFSQVNTANCRIFAD